jgi:hypothetical protein
MLDRLAWWGKALRAARRADGGVGGLQETA